MPGLEVWLHGARIAIVDQGRAGRLRLSYTEEALDRYAPGTPLLSVSLPLVSEPFPNGVTRAFLDGLLPEGEARAAIAAQFDLLASDTFGLLGVLGQDCAGALVVIPEGSPPPDVSTTLTAAPLSEEELVALVQGLRVRPLGVGGRVRLSLAGVQDKLLLTRMPGGVWGRPVDGTPSTHILKPQHPTYPRTVQNEAFCMRVAQHLGLAAANVEVVTIAGRELLVIERYDRQVLEDGTVLRVHQEDVCQALGIPPAKKYQEDGGPSLKQVAATLGSTGDTRALDVLAATVTLNVLLGNGDAHGKNFSLLHDEDGGLQLAPLYDLMSTIAYRALGLTDHMAMYIDSIQRIDRVTSDRIISEAIGWGLSRARATEAVSAVIDGAPQAITTALQEIGDPPPDLPAACEAQLDRLKGSQ